MVNAGLSKRVAVENWSKNYPEFIEFAIFRSLKRWGLGSIGRVGSDASELAAGEILHCAESVLGSQQSVESFPAVQTSARYV